MGEREATRYYALPALCLYMCTAFMAAQATSQLFVHRICQQERVHSPQLSCDSPKVTQAAAEYQFITSITTSIPSLILAGTWGGMSDKYGRKLVLNTISFITVIGSLIIYVIAHFGLSLDWIVVLAGVQSCSGGYTSYLVAIFGYVADCSTSEHRASEFSITESMIFIGASLGSLLTGVIIHNFGYINVFLFQALLALLLFLYLMWIPESLKPENRIKKVKMEKANTLAALALMAKRTKVGPWQVLAFLGLGFGMQYMYFLGWGAVGILYTRYSMHWTPEQFGYWAATQSAGRAVGVWILVPIVFRLIHQYNWKESWILIIGSGCTIITGIGYPISKDALVWYLLTIVEGLDIIFIPTIRSVFSRAVGPSEQGIALAAISSIETLVGLIAPLVYTGVFSQVIDKFPLVFLFINGGFTILSFVLVTIGGM